MDYDALRAQTVTSGQEEEAVTVNTRALIDKVLARYSGEWTTLRELLQNAADASASKINIKFETLPSATIPLPQDPTPSAILKHTLQHQRLKRLIVSNDGQTFSPNDWSRLKRIAEGNPDETKIGAFGVGFYSVFAECEEPLIRSGNEAMAFYWKGNSLFTRTSKLKDQNKDTSFILDYRNNTTTVPSLLPLCQFLATSLTFVGLSEIELYLDDFKLLHLKKTSAPSVDVQIPKFINTKTSSGLFKVTSATHETSQLDATWLKVIGWTPKAAQSTSSAASAKSGKGLQSFWNSITSSGKNHAAEKAAKIQRDVENELAKDLLGEGRATSFLHVTTGQITTSVDKNFAHELERATKKPPPRTTRLALLTTSHDEAELSNSLASSVTKAMDVFANVLPRNSGRIFIGFPTHQTTGIGAHISAPSVIPTVERESIDLNARWVRTWNEELLRAAGIISRLAWNQESIALKKQLDNLVSSSGATKLLPEHLQKILPQALHNMNQYEFSESTPSSKVGGFIEEGFWGCDKSGSLQMDLLSSRGILPSQDIRLGQDELTFLEGIPFLPKQIEDKPPALIKKLIGVDVITSVTISDIKRELERQSLNPQQLTEFLQWITKRVSQKIMDAQGAATLFKVTVANDTESDRVIQLGLVRYFQNPQRIPIGLPVPPDTIPHKYTKSISAAALSALGWEDLQLVPWVKYLLDDNRAPSKGQRLDTDADFAVQVLPAISKQWKGSSESSKQTLKGLLQNRTVIPTKLGMRKPTEAYFQSVKIFDDLPTITISNLSDLFLTALGVRKTVELNLVFDRLLNPTKRETDSPAWSHIDLIKYLASVRADIPLNDIKKLQETAICTAEGDQSGKRYMVSELYEPKDELRPLQVKFVWWPGQYKRNSDESSFLRTLGLRLHPSVKQLIEMAASPENSPELREYALRYLINYQLQHGYQVDVIASSPIPFLPVQDKEKARATPASCFTNPSAAMFGYKILREDLHPHAAKLGVKPNPPINDCIDWLLRNLPGNDKSAREVFAYFATRLNELGGQPVDRLQKSEIVPIMQSSSNGIQLKKRLPPTMCFLGRGGRYADILDYVDFGDAANAFLMRCGSKPEPTSLELAMLAINEPARILDTLNDTKRYLALLTSIAIDWPILKKDKSLVRRMKESTFLLASIERPSEISSEKKESSFADDEEESERVLSWQLAKASQIVIVDNSVDHNFFKSSVLAAPIQEELETLYLALGASLISAVVSETPRIGSTLNDAVRATKLKRLAVERLKLFLSDASKERPKRDADWVEKNLNFVPVSSLSMTKTLKGYKARYSVPINALYQIHQNGVLSIPEHIIYFKPGVEDMFHLSSALCSACLNKTQADRVLVLTTMLESSLSTLQTRGFNVSRILRKQRAEDKILREEQEKRLEEERARMAAVLAPNSPPQTPQKIKKEKEASNPAMPGAFDSPDQPHDSTVGFPQDNEQIPLLSSFKDRMRDIWNGNQSTSTLPSTGTNSGVQMAKQDGNRSIRDNGPPEDAASLKAKAEQILKASKPWTSGALRSSGLEGLVNETPSFCDSHMAQNIVFQNQTTHGVKVFCAKDMADPDKFIGANGSGLEAFGTIILTVAKAMGIPRPSVHIFQDEHSQSIAFNSGQSLFFNYRYFDAWHLADVQRGKLDGAIIYWYITMCHEAAHNVVDNHGPEFNFFMQNLLWHKFGAVAKLLRNDDDSNPTSQATNNGLPPPYRP